MDVDECVRASAIGKPNLSQYAFVAVTFEVIQTRPVLIKGVRREENAFDYVVGTAILCHDRYGEHLRWLMPLLKPGGRILFFEANFWNAQVLVKSGLLAELDLSLP